MWTRASCIPDHIPFSGHRCYSGGLHGSLPRSSGCSSGTGVWRCCVIGLVYTCRLQCRWYIFPSNPHTSREKSVRPGRSRNLCAAGLCPDSSGSRLAVLDCSHLLGVDRVCRLLLHLERKPCREENRSWSIRELIYRT